MHARCFAGALLLAAPVLAHQETIAYSRLVIRENGDVEYALKVPVEDLAETIGKSGHGPLNAPEVRAAEELLFHTFQPLVGMTSGGSPCAVERAGIEVPEDERLYGELRFVFHCPPGAPVTLDYHVFFEVDPGHMGMLEVESPGGRARAELIAERPRWEVDASAGGPPQVRPVGAGTSPPANGPRPVAAASADISRESAPRAEHGLLPHERDTRVVNAGTSAEGAAKPTRQAYRD